MSQRGSPRKWSCVISLRRLYTVFERSETSLVDALPIRKTSSGIWVPTPVPVIEEAIAVLRGIGLLGQGAPRGAVVDAGTGDGRIPAVLAWCDPERSVYGIERDSALYTQALENQRVLESKGVIDHGRIRLINGDYCDLSTYETCGIHSHHIGLVFNYPDGNERRLARFVARHGGSETRLCLLTHDRSLELDELELRDRRDVRLDAEPDWSLTIYGTPTA